MEIEVKSNWRDIRGVKMMQEKTAHKRQIQSTTRRELACAKRWKETLMLLILSPPRSGGCQGNSKKKFCIVVLFKLKPL